MEKKNIFIIREVDSVHVHENEALAKGNKQTKKNKKKTKKKEITPLENKISLHWLHWSGLGMALSRFFNN